MQARRLWGGIKGGGGGSSGGREHIGRGEYSGAGEDEEHSPGRSEGACQSPRPDEL